MASFLNVRRFPEPSAYAEGVGVAACAKLVDLLAAVSVAAIGALVAPLELATLQRNELVPAYVPRPVRARSLAGSRPCSDWSSQ